ncbi:MAG TPA: hypothetical protein VGF33_07730 [Caulobacteraceae bacterium]
MPRGPGKYDHLATAARVAAGARAVIVMVIDGDLGSGFSVQADEPLALTLPAILRDLADQIEAGAP